MLRKLGCLLVVLAMALTLVGCAQRPPEVIQRELNEALEEQAKVIASDMKIKDKIAKAKEIAARIGKLADEAKQHGELTTAQLQQIAESRQQALKAAEDLKEAVTALGKKGS